MQKGEPPTRRVNFSPPLASGSVGGLGREGGRLSAVIGLRAGRWGHQASPACIEVGCDRIALWTGVVWWCELSPAKVPRSPAWRGSALPAYKHISQAVFRIGIGAVVS